MYWVSGLMQREKRRKKRSYGQMALDLNNLWKEINT